jgi:hypothetical protein
MPKQFPLYRRLQWPNLQDEDYIERSEDTTEYNCIAFSVGSKDEWWWPIGGYYWPPDVPAEPTLAAFRIMYERIGYEVCNDGAIEEGYEKVVIYADAGDTPTHAALQLPSGNWTSKLGSDIDIEHSSLECLAGGSYGDVAMFMRRPRVREAGADATVARNPADPGTGVRGRAQPGS